MLCNFLFFFFSLLILSSTSSKLSFSLEEIPVPSESSDDDPCTHSNAACIVGVVLGKCLFSHRLHELQCITPFAKLGADPEFTGVYGHETRCGVPGPNHCGELGHRVAWPDECCSGIARVEDHLTKDLVCVESKDCTHPRSHSCNHDSQCRPGTYCKHHRCEVLPCGECGEYPVDGRCCAEYAVLDHPGPDGRRKCFCGSSGCDHDADCYNSHNTGHCCGGACCNRKCTRGVCF